MVGLEDINFNSLLALTSMVINPAYYTHSSHVSHQKSLRLQATSQHYLSRVDHEVMEGFVQPSLGAHRIWLLKIDPKVLVDERTFTNFQYPIEHDMEWALEFARLVEKFLGRNSQGFTSWMDQHGQMRSQGVDFVGFINYSWDPELPGLSQDLQTRRRSHFMERNGGIWTSVLSALQRK